MYQQNFLNESDIDTLINLLLRSQQSRTREALCYSIGIDPKQLSFLRNSSDSDFFLLLIGYLNDVGDKEALCKLCCRELFPIFNKSTHRSILEEIGVKLNCNYDFGQNSPKNKTVEQSTSPIHSSVPEFGVNYPNPDESKSESLFTKIGTVNKKLLAGGAILLMGLPGFFIVQSFNNPGSNPRLTPPSDSPPQTTSVTVAYQGDKYGCSLPIAITIGNTSFLPKGNSFLVNNIEIGKQKYQISGNISCPTGSLPVVCQVSGNGLINVVPDKTYNLSWKNTAYGQCEVILQ